MARRKKKNLLESKIFLVVVVIAFSALLIPIFKNIEKRKEVNSELTQLEEQISELENKNEELSEFIEYLESDKFVEEQARLNLGMKKQDEKVVFVDLSSPEKEKTLAQTKEEKYEKLSNPGKWWVYFFEK